MAADGVGAKAALDKVGQAVSHAKENKMSLAREKARAEFLEVTAPMRSKVMGSLKSGIKAGILADPDMWPCIKNTCNAILDNLLTDVEKEIERNLHTALLQQQEDADAPGPSGGIFCLWYRLRAFLLYHYLPHDKMMFGKLKDPVYMLIYLATMVPIHGLRVCIFAFLLFLLVVPGRPDEFQLINFILLCKGTQFFTSGLIQMAAGATKYFVCFSVAKDNLLECIVDHGPGAEDGFGLALDYLGSIAVVWVAFGLLKRSEKHGLDSKQKETAEEAERAEEAGGRLRSLLDYDRRCFFASITLLVLLTALTCWQHFADGGGGIRGLAYDPQFSANIFWCCVGYSLMSLPFAPFMISGLQEVMTHCFATGYNVHGACVPFDTPAVETNDDQKVHHTYSRGLTTFAAHATSLVNTINRGRALRGAEDDNAFEYKFGDFTRGVWAQMTSSKPPARRLAPAHAPSGIPETESPSFASSRPAAGSASTDWWHGEEISRVFKQLGTGEETHSESITADAMMQESFIINTVSAVKIPPEKMEEHDGHWAFCLQVVPEGSLDAENGSEEWQVLRRYTDFEKLAGLLGSHCYSFENAHFPKKTWGACTGEKLEKRRRKLEAWINCALQDSLAQHTWARPLHEFLTAEKYSEEAEGKNVLEDVAVIGSKFRGGEGAYQFGDFTRGLLSKMNKSTGNAQSSNAQSSTAEPSTDEGTFQFGDFTRNLMSKVSKSAGGAQPSAEQTTSQVFTSLPNLRLPEEQPSMEDFLEGGPPGNVGAAEQSPATSFESRSRGGSGSSPAAPVHESTPKLL